MKKHLIALSLSMLFITGTSIYAQEKKINIEVIMDDDSGMKIIKTEENGNLTIDTILFDEIPQQADLFKEFKFMTSDDSVNMEKTIVIELDDNDSTTHKTEKVFVVKTDGHSPHQIHKEFVWTSDDSSDESYDSFKQLAEKDGWQVTKYSREMKNDKERIVIVREKMN